MSCRIGLIGVAAWLVSAPASAATIYLCQSYGGGAFWSNTSCGQQKALLQRTVSVPDGMPFEQQVQLGEQARAEAQRLTNPPNEGRTIQSTQITTTTTTAQQEACAQLERRIRELDASARQPQSGQVQDQITAEKRAARDRQSQLRCR